MATATASEGRIILDIRYETLDISISISISINISISIRHEVLDIRLGLRRGDSIKTAISAVL